MVTSWNRSPLIGTILPVNLWLSLIVPCLVFSSSIPCIFIFLVCLLFFFLAGLPGLWNLLSLTRDWTWATTVEELSPTHWTTTKFLFLLFHLISKKFRIIALQHCISFCWRTKWISYRYTYIPSLLSLPPTLCATEQLPTSYLFYTW